MLKKYICMILSSFLIISSVLLSYQQTVHAFDIPTAFWGTLEASRALWTGLQTGGALSNGISISSFERSSREDMANFQAKVLLAYNAFCVYKEKAKLLIDHPDWSMDQITTEATNRGYEDFTSFKNNAIQVSNTTGKISLKDWGYWREFCSEIKSVAQNGLGSGSIGDDTEVRGKITFGSGTGYQNATNLGINTFNYNDHYYIYKGLYPKVSKNGNEYTVSTFELSVSSAPTDRVRIPFVNIWSPNNANLYVQFYHLDVNRLTGEYINNTIVSDRTDDIGYVANNSELVHSIVAHTSFPVRIFCPLEDEVSFAQNYVQNLSVASGSGSVNEDFQNDIATALNETEVGSAIKEGGTSVPEIVKENDVPIKRSSVKVGEETATGAIGWDIPSTDVLEGSIAQPQAKEQEEVIEGIGVITVPEENVIEGTIDDTVITWDKGEAITVPGVEDETITTTIDDVISIQGGEYYPKQFDITGFFPFCIPFDIAYCVNKFNVGHGEAPIIHIPIVYPRILQGTLGESYDVIIDFNEYIALRNIIRGFILLFFLVGLMQLTRNIIRG